MTERVIIGRQSDGSYGVRITVPGVSAATATVPKDFAFNSDWGQYGSIHLSGEVTVDDVDVTVPFPELPHPPIVISVAQLYSASPSSDWFPRLWNNFYYYPRIGTTTTSVVFHANGQGDQPSAGSSVTRLPKHVVRYIVLKVRGS